jgi:uncharacterized protein
MAPIDTVTRQLCLACGICCNGVLFRDVALRPGDDAGQLESLGLALSRLKTKTRFQQPCSALGPLNRCRIYGQRPEHCRTFQCALFQAVAGGTVGMAGAFRTVQKTLKLARRVSRLLCALGDTDETRALAGRFRRMQRRLETWPPDAAGAATFAKLTQVVHQLNLALRRGFYP